MPRLKHYYRKVEDFFHEFNYQKDERTIYTDYIKGFQGKFVCKNNYNYTCFLVKTDNYIRVNGVAVRLYIYDNIDINNRGSFGNNAPATSALYSFKLALDKVNNQAIEIKGVPQYLSIKDIADIRILDSYHINLILNNFIDTISTKLRDCFRNNRKIYVPDVNENIENTVKTILMLLSINPNRNEIYKNLIDKQVLEYSDYTEDFINKNTAFNVIEKYINTMFVDIFKEQVIKNFIEGIHEENVIDISRVFSNTVDNYFINKYVIQLKSFCGIEDEKVQARKEKHWKSLEEKHKKQRLNRSCSYLNASLDRLKNEIKNLSKEAHFEFDTIYIKENKLVTNRGLSVTLDKENKIKLYVMANCVLDFLSKWDIKEIANTTKHINIYLKEINEKIKDTLIEKIVENKVQEEINNENLFKLDSFNVNFFHALSLNHKIINSDYMQLLNDIDIVTNGKNIYTSFNMIYFCVGCHYFTLNEIVRFCKEMFNLKQDISNNILEFVILDREETLGNRFHIISDNKVEIVKKKVKQKAIEETKRVNKELLDNFAEIMKNKSMVSLMSLDKVLETISRYKKLHNENKDLLLDYDEHFKTYESN